MSEPIYCGECKSQYIWERYKVKDIADVSGNVMWEGFKCKKCGNTTIVPVRNSETSK